MQRLVVVVSVLMTCAACWAAEAPATQPAKLPPKVEPFAQLAEQCAKYQALIYGATWRTVYDEDFSGKNKPTWSSPTVQPAIDANGQPQKKIDPTCHPHMRLNKDEDRVVLYFEGSPEQGVLHIGPKVKGDFVLEIVAKALSERPCDMSLFLDRIDSGPGFQFGAHYNTKNKLWVGPVKQKEDPTASAEQYIDLPNDVLIQKNIWHKVRMEVREGQVTASVDGKPVGKAKLADGYAPGVERQPLVYVYMSAIELKQARIETLMPGEKKVDEKQAWEQVFGKATRQEIKAKIENMTDLLADDDWLTRDTAQRLLGQMGDLALGPVELAARDGLPEQQARAREIRKVLRPIAQTQPTKSAAPPPPDDADQ